MSRYTDIVEKVESRTADLAERGNSLHLAANLRFVDGGTSSKYHKSALIGRYIFVWYGKFITQGEEGFERNRETNLKEFATEEEAAKKYWALLREKVGKGYLVQDSAVLAFSPSVVTGLSSPAGSSAHLNAVDNICSEWTDYLVARKVVYRKKDKNGIGDEHNASPRTAKQGVSVIRTLQSGSPDPEVLLECALAASNESFLHGMVLTHPACPQKAKAARALVEMKI